MAETHLCIDCKHVDREIAKNWPKTHVYWKCSPKPEINYVTGARDVYDCTSLNRNGMCDHFQPKDRR